MRRLSPFSFLLSHFRQGGFTFPEVILVLGIFVMMLGLAAPLLSGFLPRSLFDDAAEQITQDLRRAQAFAVAGEGTTGPGNRDHGVYFDVAGERWILFRGSAYVEGAAENEEHTLSRAVDLVSVSLNGGGSSVIFRERTGQTTQSGTVTLSGGGKTATITIYGTGVIVSSP